MSVGSDPLDLLIVGWYPGADDPVAGRFVADQAAALLASGRVRPSVVSFEPLPLVGDIDLGEATAAAWEAVVRDAAAAGLAFADPAPSVAPGVPVARLGRAAGGTRSARRMHPVTHRAAALGAFLDGAAGAATWPIIHAHVGYPEGAAVAKAAVAREIPFVLTEHATYLDRMLADPAVRSAYHDGARAAARIVAVGEVLAEQLRRAFPDLVDRIVVIPNAVDVAAFRPVGPSERDPDELLWVGYRREVKGLPALLRALAIVREQRPAARLRLIGRSTSDEEEAGWQRLATGLGVADSVSFEPPADRAGVARAMERAALFVHPSRIETMGIVAVEALAAGLPVVAVDSGGVTEVLGSDPSAVGALVPVQEPGPLAAAILATLDRRLEFDPAALRGSVVARYAAPAVAGRLADLYDVVLAERGGQGRRTAAREPRGTVEPVRPTVLVSIDRATLDRALEWLPPATVRHLAIVTCGEAVIGPATTIRLSADVARDLDAIAALGQRARLPGVRGLLRAPGRWLGRRVGRERLINRVLRAVRAGIEAALDEAPRDEREVVVCLTGLDVLAVEPLRVAGRVVVAPGGARWLADRRASEDVDG